MVDYPRPAMRAAWLLMLCVVHAATTMASAVPSEKGQRLLLQQAVTDSAAVGFNVARDSSNSRRLLNRLMLQQQDSKQAVDSIISEFNKQQNSGHSDMKPLFEIARAASGPSTVVIVDDSQVGRNQRQAGAPEEEEIVVVPVFEPAAPGTQLAAPVPIAPAATPRFAPVTTVSTVPGDAAQVFVPVPAVPGQISQVEVITPIGQQPPPITFVPTQPITPTEPVAPPPKVIPAGPYCIPRAGNSFSVLAIGDSITQGSVPSKNLNHPYTIKLQEVLEPALQARVRAVDAGLGGGGVFMTGFNVPVTFGPWLDTYMGQGPWDVVVIMIGINDLLRGGRAADDIMNGLKPMIEKVLATKTPVILMPPFAAPGFVQENDSKEGERKKLAQLFRSYSVQHASSTRGVGPQVWMLDLQASPFEFYSMSAEERTKWLDDGLHMTEVAYDTVGQLVAQEISRKACQNPVTSNIN